MMTSFISIILVEPENPDNIGAVARAMKNMGLGDLRLVRPVPMWKKKGKKMAMSAGDLLREARVFCSVEEVVADLNLVIGTTRRGGPKRGMFLPFANMVRKIKKVKHPSRVGIMFGRESKGLDNESLSFCDWVTTIPVHPNYPSINLAQAVMIVSFSLFDRSITLPRMPPKRGQYRGRGEAPELKKGLAFLSKEEVRVTLDHVERALAALGYQHKKNRVLERIRITLERLFKRSGLLECEAQMFKGLSRRIYERITEGEGPSA